MGLVAGLRKMSMGLRLLKNGRERAAGSEFWEHRGGNCETSPENEFLVWLTAGYKRGNVDTKAAEEG